MDDTRLEDGEVEQRLVRLDSLLERLEAIPGSTTELALEAIEALTEVYGTALARIVAFLEDDAVLSRLCADELVDHLMRLHGVHPDPVEQRIERVLADVRGQLGGAKVALSGIEDGVATIEVTATGCRSTAAATASSIGDLVLAAAPELAAVAPVAVQPPSDPALIPVEALLRRPVSS